MIIVDLDSTLYDFQTPLAHTLRKHVGDIVPPVSDIHEWEWYIDRGITKRQFYSAINDTHARQLDHSPYIHGLMAIDAWYRDGQQIAIATHRMPAYRDTTIKWLQNHAVNYACLYCAPSGKERLFMPGDVVIDDSPHNLLAALAKGCTAATLEWGWNKQIRLAHPEIISATNWTDLSTRINERCFSGDYSELEKGVD